MHLPVGDGRQRTRRRSLAVRLALPIAIFVAWWILTETGVIPPTTLSTPSATWDAFVQLLLHQDLIGDIGISVRRALLGLALGAGVGLILGIIVGLYRLGEELLDASMQMLRMVPYPALIFLFIIWFGVGETSHVLLIAPGHAVPHVPQHLQRRAQRGPAGRRGGPQLRGAAAGSWSAASSCRSPCRPS